jgi:hypothetical protein
MSEIQALRLKQKNLEFESSVEFIVRPCQNEVGRGERKRVFSSVFYESLGRRNYL